MSHMLANNIYTFDDGGRTFIIKHVLSNSTLKQPTINIDKWHINGHSTSMQSAITGSSSCEFCLVNQIVFVLIDAMLTTKSICFSLRYSTTDFREKMDNIIGLAVVLRHMNSV